MPHFALVTGVGHRGGIGFAICRRLAVRGDAVFVTRFGAFDATREFSGQTDVPWPSIDADLEDPQSIGAIFDAAQHKLGAPVDILINNHAHFHADSLDSLTVEQFDRHMAVNVRGALLLCQEYARRNKSGWGRIINLVSGTNVGPMESEISYAISKGAIECATLSLSRAVVNKGITVNAVDPGGTQTGWMAGVGADGKADTPRGRVGLPTDAADLVAFLSSAEGGWINGQVLRSRGWV